MHAPLLVATLMAGGTALFITAAVLYRRRLRRYRDQSPTRLNDDLVRAIEQEGAVELDEPTNRDEVREEEERFWSETWDRPDEW